MLSLKVYLFLGALAFAKASPTKTNNLFDSNADEMRALCADDDPIACLKLKALSFFDSLLQKNNFKIGDDIEVSRNAPNEIPDASARSIEDNVESFIKNHDVTFKLPIMDQKLTLTARNLDSNELDFKLNFGGQPEARKSKIKKIVAPILVFVLLKAMTLVPLALGILGLKAWNALQLSFFSFLVSVGLAIFQLCKKIATEHAPPQISAHPPWEPALTHYAARNLDAQNLAYAGHVL